MNEVLNDFVQNRFTAYLVAAVTNKRMRYLENKKKLHAQEVIQMDLLEKNYQDFEMQYYFYKGEQTSFIFQDWERIGELLIVLESEKLRKEIAKLKARERRLLFARVFGELTFEELGEKFDMKPKQAEMAFYYILRKIRKEMEVKGIDEF